MYLYWSWFSPSLRCYCLFNKTWRVGGYTKQCANLLDPVIQSHLVEWHLTTAYSHLRVCASTCPGCGNIKTTPSPWFWFRQWALNKPLQTFGVNLATPAATKRRTTNPATLYGVTLGNHLKQSRVRSRLFGNTHNEWKHLRSTYIHTRVLLWIWLSTQSPSQSECRVGAPKRWERSQCIAPHDWLTVVCWQTRPGLYCKLAIATSHKPITVPVWCIGH